MSYIRIQNFKGKDRKVYKCYNCNGEFIFMTYDGGKTFEKENLDNGPHKCSKRTYSKEYSRKWMDNEIDYCDCGMCSKCQKRGVSVI